MGAAKKASKKDLDDGEEPLQAVLLADSFKKRLAPISYTTPKILLPICNVPIIEYTLELLVTAGVKDLYIVCSAHADKIQEYCATSPSCRQFTVNILNVPGCKSIGEALREVDARGKIRGDFILVSGDVVSNIKLAPALAAHKHRREVHHPGDSPGANRWFLKSTPIQILPAGGGICGRLSPDLPLGCLQGGFRATREQLQRFGGLYLTAATIIWP